MKRKDSKSVRAHRQDDLRPEYDFSAGVRGKHAAQYAAGTNVVVLDPDVVEVFPTAEEVNEALRALARLIRAGRGRRRRSGGTA